MLSKKQYITTLLVAVLVFFVMFAMTTWYFSKRNWTGRTQEVVEEKAPVSSEMKKAKEEIILPQTKITLKIEDLTTHKEVKTSVDASSLLGLNKEELADRFDDYTVETFNEKEVCLKKSMASEVVEKNEATYVLGVDGETVCIKELDKNNRPIKIDYGVKHLSSYVYSLLLNEEIEITDDQKEALLLNPNMLQKILQDYVGE